MRHCDLLAAQRLIPIRDLATAARVNENDFWATADELRVTRTVLGTRLECATFSELDQISHQLQRIEVAA